MSLSISKTPQSVEIRDGNKPCGTYHYDNMFKSFFRGLYTPAGKDVVACPPPEHLHHKGLQFGLCTSQANFWEEDEANEPQEQQLPIGKQQTTNLELLPAGDGIGFMQDVCWETDNVCLFNERRMISVEEASGAYVWTWQTTLTAAVPDVHIITSVWSAPPYCSSPGYCGLGIRLAPDLFKGGEVLPLEIKCGSTPTCVSFRGKGAEVRFEQNASQADTLFVSTIEGNPPYAPGGPGFAFIGLVPVPRDLKQGDSLECSYVITVSDVNLPPCPA
jgi:Methane oxygenase PmoA